MKMKSILAIIVTLTMLISIAAVPIYAEITPTFRIQGKVVLPGTDTVTDNSLFITIKYRSDKGTDYTDDYYEKNTLIILFNGAHEAPFSINVPYTASSDKSAEFTLEYSISPGTKFWEHGYYGLNGMQYYKEGQMLFSEGNTQNVVITPLRAAEISGSVSLPEYQAGVTAEVEISAKTLGSSSENYDDFEARTTVDITDTSADYKLRVPANITISDYIVMYSTEADDYEGRGWYNSNGTVPSLSYADKLDTSKGNYTGINFMLINKSDFVEAPSETDFDLNDDNRVDVSDTVLVARAMRSANKYQEKYDLNKDGIINVEDLKLMKAEIEKLDSHKK